MTETNYHSPRSSAGIPGVTPLVSRSDPKSLHAGLTIGGQIKPAHPGFGRTTFPKF